MIQKDYHGEVDHERLGSKPGLAPSCCIRILWAYRLKTFFNRCGVTTEEVGVTYSGYSAWPIVGQTPLSHSSCTLLDVGVSNPACSNYKISLHLRCSFVATREVWKKAKGHHLCSEEKPELLIISGFAHIYVKD